MTENLERARHLQERVHTYLKTGLLNEARNLKEDWRTFSYILSTLPITGLYHITDSKNVQSIFKHGCLMSSNAQNKKGILVWGATSKPKSYANCVHLSLCPHVSIFRALKQQSEQPVLLTIDPIAALLKGTIFRYCADPATRQYYGNETTESLLKINFEAEFQSLSQDLQKQEAQAEMKTNPSQYRNAVILVPDEVPSFLIKDIKLL